MIFKSSGKIHRWPKGDINQIIENSKFKPFVYKVIIQVGEPFRKHIARHGVEQSDLNYGRVK